MAGTKPTPYWHHPKGRATLAAARAALCRVEAAAEIRDGAAAALGWLGRDGGRGGLGAHPSENTWRRRGRVAMLRRENRGIGIHSAAGRGAEVLAAHGVSGGPAGSEP